MDDKGRSLYGWNRAEFEQSMANFRQNLHNQLQNMRENIQNQQQSWHQDWNQDYYYRRLAGSGPQDGTVEVFEGIDKEVAELMQGLQGLYEFVNKQVEQQQIELSKKLVDCPKWVKQSSADH